MKGYYEYKNGIYPRKLWIHIGKDLKKLLKKEFEGGEISEEDYIGITYSELTRKKDGTYGVLVSFKSQKEMTMDNCCHEASHICDAFESILDIEHGGEASAYLMGWIGSCMIKACCKEGKFINI